MRHRWYDDAQGRFITRDPAGYVDGLSLYLYARGNPIIYYDPYGLGACTIWDYVRALPGAVAETLDEHSDALGAELAARAQSLAEDHGRAAAGETDLLVSTVLTLTGSAKTGNSLVGYDAVQNKPLTGYDRAGEFLQGAGQMLLTGLGFYSASGTGSMTAATGANSSRTALASTNSAPTITGANQARSAAAEGVAKSGV